MLLDFDSCYSALVSHDPRFDGQFFVAVSSTKIYCRTVCPARRVKRENCSFFVTAAAAEAAGYRPCLRCRPEMAPGNARIDAVSRVAAEALSRIDDGALTDGTLADLAEQLNVSERHLRRVVKSEYGVSPVELAQTYRLLMAKRLLTDTDLSVGEIAFASGFNSIRRFNHLFSTRYRLNPTNLRKGNRSGTAVKSLLCEIAYKTPYDWSSMLKFLADRAIPGVEVVTNSTYSRSVTYGQRQGWIVATPLLEQNRLKLEVSVSLATNLRQVVKAVKGLFDLTSDPTEISSHLGQLSELRPGLRLPGSFDGFETAVRAILGQRISVKAATTLSGRIAQAFGDVVDAENAPSGITHCWPSDERISYLSVSDVASLGVLGRSAEAIVSLARMVSLREICLESAADKDVTMKLLKSLPGVGEWTAQYVAMRVLRCPDSFPSGDLAIRKALGMTGEREIYNHAEQWRPWRSYAAIHLWRSLDTK